MPSLPITTTIAPMHGGRLIFIALLCAVFGLWGLYDLFVAIPRQEERFKAYTDLSERMRELEKLGPAALERDRIERDEIQRALAALAPDGEVPTRPNAMDRITQWAFISCILAVPFVLSSFVKTKRKTYRLDEEETLHFAGDDVLGSGAWRRDEIADIDMSRWMAKSIAHAVHLDGRRLKLDAYHHKNLDLIIGAIASRLHPQQWDAQAKPVKIQEPQAPNGEPQNALSEPAETV